MKANVADTEDARKHASAGSGIHAKAGMSQWSDMTKASAQNMKVQAQERNQMCSAKTRHQLPTMWQRSHQQPHRGTGTSSRMQTRTEGTRKCASTEHAAFEQSNGVRTGHRIWSTPNPMERSTRRRNPECIQGLVSATSRSSRTTDRVAEITSKLHRIQRQNCTHGQGETQGRSENHHPVVVRVRELP
jgi:hypothetical protein